MHFILRIIAKFAVNALILYAALNFSGFTITGGIKSLFIAALVITLLNVFIKPIVRFISLPLVWLTLGFFLIVINVAILWLADILLPSIKFSDPFSLITVSIIIGIANHLIG